MKLNKGLHCDNAATSAHNVSSRIDHLVSRIKAIAYQRSLEKAKERIETEKAYALPVAHLRRVGETIGKGCAKNFLRELMSDSGIALIKSRTMNREGPSGCRMLKIDRYRIMKGIERKYGLHCGSACAPLLRNHDDLIQLRIYLDSVFGRSIEQTITRLITDKRLRIYCWGGTYCAWIEDWPNCDSSLPWNFNFSEYMASQK